MRYYEIAGGFRMDISSEESDILDLAKDELIASSLDDRDLEVARKMISRGLLIMLTRDDTEYYVQNKLPDIQRF